MTDKFFEDEKRPRVPGDLFKEVKKEDEDKPFHKNLEKLVLGDEDE